MRFIAEDLAPASARWTTRLAFFSAALVAAALFLHRVFSMPTPVATNIVIVAYAGVGLSLLLALAATVRIWRVGGPGTARVVAGVFVCLAMLTWPLVYMPTYFNLPPINDVTTDTASPPPFSLLAKARPPGANNPAYPGPSFAAAQAAAYPDLKSLVIERSSEEALAVAADALRRLRFTIVREEGPEPAEGRPGMIEAVERTLVLGFTDDVAIRVEGDADRARIDVRSASRYGGHDFGRNADRVRRILREIVAVLEETVPTADGSGRRSSRALKRLKDRNQKWEDRRRSQGRAREDARRGPEPKATPPPRDERRSRDR